MSGIQDKYKTKEQLCTELAVLRQRISDLEASEADQKKKKSVLTEPEEKYRTFIDEIDEGLFVADNEGYLTFVNKALARIHGFKEPGELIGRNIAEFIVPEARAAMIEERREVMNTNEFPKALELPYINKDGSTGVFELRPGPIIQEGEVIGTSGILIDITERKRIEEALRESEEKYRTIVDEISDCIVVTDENGVITFANKAYADVLGYDNPENIKGRNFFEFVSSTEPVKELLYKRKESIQTGEFPEVIEVQVIKKNGDVGLFEVKPTAVMEGGKVIGTRAVIRDITERKKAEEELRISEETLNNILESSPDAILVNDFKGNIIRCNRASSTMYGAPADEIIGMKAMDLIAPWEIERLRKDIAKCIKRGFMKNMEYVCLSKSGKEFPAEISSSITADQSGGLKYYVSIIKDISERRLVEEKLRESEAKYSALVEQAVDAVYIFQNDKIVFCNAATAEMSGYAKDELIGMPFMDFVVTNDNKTFMQRFKERVAGKDAVPFIEVDIRCKDGCLKSVEGSIARIQYQGMPAIMGIAHDITNRKQMEVALRESEEKFRAQYKSIPSPTYTWQKIGNDFVIVDYNDAAKALIIDDAEQLLGKTTKYLFGNNPEIVEDISICMNQHVHIAKRALTWIETITESRFLFISHAFVPPNSVTTTLVDITEPMRIQQALEESEKRYRTLVEEINDGLVELDERGQFIFVNDKFSEMMGYSKEELIGHHPSDFLDKVNNRVFKQQWRIGKKRSVKSYELTWKGKDGFRLITIVSPQVIFDEEGKFRSAISVITDITERKRSQEQFIVTDRLVSIGQLAAGVAHEINNPLTGITGFSQLLLEKDIPEEFKRDLNIINSEAQRAATIIRNLLGFAKKNVPLKQSVNINEIISKVLDMRAYEQNVSNIQINTNFAVDLPDIIADYFQLQQVFLNIIINAEYFMLAAHDKGTLTIITEKAGDSVRASFIDDGPGISKDNLGHVFDPFFTTKEVGSGTGLGLSVCHGIVTEHDGNMHVESEMGQGATFIVELPIRKDPKRKGK
jgi:PAS domain S-box-containing protein